MKKKNFKASIARKNEKKIVRKLTNKLIKYSDLKIRNNSIIRINKGLNSWIKRKGWN